MNQNLRSGAVRQDRVGAQASVVDTLQPWPSCYDDRGANDAPTILLVEDEAFVRDVTSEVLRSSGYAVLTARNAADAARLYEEHRYEISLVVTDVILPGQTGLALAAGLRRENPDLKVLFVTGYPEQMKGMGEDDCLAKPFSTDALLARVGRLLSSSEFCAAGEDAIMPACVAV
jgi:DNA-binding response OmpR family regulator